VKLTARNIQTLALPAGKTDFIQPDDAVPGLGVRVRLGGSKTWVFQYKIGDQQRRISLGAVSAIDIGRARNTAKDLYAEVRLGRDPAATKADARIKASETFAAVADRFLAYKRARLKGRTYVELERYITRDAKPLHPMQLAEISKRDIATILAATAENSGFASGNRARVSLNTLFVWAMAQGLTEGPNPVAGTLKNPERSRDRVLAPEELRLIWTHASDDHFGSVIKLLMLTGQRLREISELAWSEVDFDKRLITLDGTRTKNGRSHAVPLSGPTYDILAAQPRRVTTAGYRDKIFGVGSGGFAGFSRAKNALNERITQATGKVLPDWRLHDLRRAYASHSAEIGIEPHHIEAVMNHVGHQRGVHGIYNRATYEPAKRIALDRWAAVLTAWIEQTENNVTTFRRA
jgi:integrase